ncbi:MAG: SGNH/GDSL hydrolase family protein [Candidatus Omnitrophota bacterium]
MINKIINIMLMLFSMVFCLFIVELGLRLFAPQIVQCKVNYEWRADDDVLPYVSKPDYHGRMILQNQFDVELITNSAGFRNRENFGLEKNEGVERIAFIGDSFTFGWGVGNDEVYTALFGASLNSGGRDKKAEVMNAAVYGYDIVQYGEVFNRILKYDPDVIVLGFCLENDFNITPLKVKGENRDEGGVRVEKEDMAYHVRQFINNLHIAAMIRDRLYITFPKIRNIMLSMGINNKRDIFLKDYTENLNKSLKETEEILVDMNKRAEERGAKFIVVLIPLKEQIYCREEINKFPEYDIDRPNKVMADMLIRNNIEYIDLLTGMLTESVRTKEKLYLDIDPHWTPAGHKKAAEIIYEAVGQ